MYLKMQSYIQVVRGVGENMLWEDKTTRMIYHG